MVRTLTNTGTTTQIGTSTGAGQDGNGNKISYHLPAMGGLTAGVSFQNGGVLVVMILNQWVSIMQ